MYWSLTIEELAKVQVHTEEGSGAKLTNNKFDKCSIPHNPKYFSYANKDQNKMKFPYLVKRSQKMLATSS